MALVELAETWRGQSLSYQQNFQEDALGNFVQERKHTIKFFWESDDQTDSCQTILNQAIAWGGPGPSLPLIGETYGDDSGARLWTYGVTREDESANHGLIECVYATHISPLDEPAKVSYSSASRERVFEGALAFVLPDGSGEDLPGASIYYPLLGAGEPYPITNSAFTPFVPPPVDQEQYLVMTITKNLSVDDWQPQDFLENFVRCVNGDVYTVKGTAWDIGRVFLAEAPKAQETWDRNTGVRYWATQWTFWCRVRGWNLILADMGYWELFVADDPTSPLVPIYKFGRPAQVPVKLNGHGQEADLNEPMEWMEYRVRELVDFHTLPLGI